MTPPKWTLRVLVAAGVAAALATASRAHAQPKAPPVIVFPQLNSFPGLPAAPFNPPAFNPGPFYNPALNNPWLNQTRIIPVNPFTNPAFTNPLANPFANPFVNNPLANPFANNPFAVNPFVNNPFAVNAFANNAFVNAPFAHPPFGPNAFAANPFANPFALASFSTPPIAIQQPGYLLYRGPNLQVNPWSGTVYRPLSGVARTADGHLFYRVPGTGLPTVTGAYATGTGLYFDPKHNTFLNPNTGVISRPGVTNIFIPWIP